MRDFAYKVPMSSLNLGVIGNCTYGALVDDAARIVWCCLPRFDADPVFCSLIDDDANAGAGFFAVELLGAVRTEQRYIANTAILETRIEDGEGGSVVVTDFAPRFHARGRTFRPTTLVRRIRPSGGSPRIRIRIRPRFNYGARAPDVTHGSNHIRYAHTSQALRLNTSAPITYVLEETPFLLEEPVSLLLGPDETLAGGVDETARVFEEETAAYWRRWTRRLALPFEWQEAVTRAAITLKLCAFEETGAIIAAMTTSIPEAAATERNWDYRYCWLRDSFFVVRALNSLAEVETMEDYLRYLNNIISTNHAQSAGGHLQPVFGIALQRRLTERVVGSLAGYRGMGPVRAGNQAFEHVQHDVYGNAVLAASQAFFDTRLLAKPGLVEFERLEWVGERAFAMHDQPDAGMWELRTMARVHSSSSLMCWAACDRLAKIAAHLGASDRKRALAAAGRDGAPNHPRPGLEPRPRGVRRELRGRGPRREPAADGRGRVHRPARRAVPVDGGPHRAGAAPGATTSSGTPPPTTSACPIPRSTSAPSGTSTPSPESGAATKRGRSSRPCWNRGTRSACCPRTSIPRAASCGGTIPRPTRSSASSTRRRA